MEYDYIVVGAGSAGSVMASDVVCSSTTVAFRALRQTDEEGDNCLSDEETVLGFIVLDRLPDVAR